MSYVDEVLELVKKKCRRARIYSGGDRGAQFFETCCGNK